MSVVEEFVGLSVAQCDAKLDKMEVDHRQRMKTLRAFVRAKAAEEKGGESSDASDLLDRFVALEARRRELEDELDATKKQIAGLQEPLLEEWAERGVQSVKINGFTVYPHTRFYCSKKGGVQTADVCRTLEALGLGDMVGPSYSASSLTSKVKEMADDGGDLPDELGRMLNFGEITKLATRRA